MTFEYDFFSNNILNWEKILKKFKNKEKIKALEIGCFEGMATKWLLENILTKENSKIDVIDTFKGSSENKEKRQNIQNLLKRFEENTKEYSQKIKVYKGFSSSILKKITKNQYNIIYIDGSHIAKDVLEDAVLSWPLLKSNGIMIFDDYNWKFYKNELMCPKIGINSFLKVYKGRYFLIKKEYQVFIKKIKKEKIDPNKTIKKINNCKKEIIKLKKDLNKIQSSKTYKIWQLFNKFKKNKN